MTDPRALADEATLHLDRLGAVILDDVGDGPSPGDLVAAATATRDAVTRIGVTALTQLTGLVATVAESILNGTTEWSTSLGGTLLAAVDDLRRLVGRAMQFSDEDNEHLHHRASELSVYVRAAVSQTPVMLSEQSFVLNDSDGSTVHPQNAAPSRVPTEQRTTGSWPTAPVMPISNLFYTEGPQVVSGGVPQSAGKKSDLLGRGIDALEHLTAKPFAKPVVVGIPSVVPVETLTYRGRAALERAAAIREQIKAAGPNVPKGVLDEMYDLIGLALKD